jgi:hypothetical protein
VLDGAERTGVLVIRAWMEPGHAAVRTRITGRADVLADEETVLIVAGADAASRAAFEWLTAFEHGSPTGGGLDVRP